jgi:Zn-dependent protease
MDVLIKWLLAVGGFSALLIGAIAIHETGHVIANVLVGLRVASVRVGPLEVTRGKRWTTRWIWNLWFSGLVRTSAASLDQRWVAARYAFAVACGPLTNLLVAGVLIFFIRSQHGIWGAAFFWLIVFNLMFGVMNFIPFSAKRHDTDGKRLIHFLFQRKRREAFEARLTYPFRLAEFKRMFESGEIDAAAEQLHIMDKVSSERNVDRLIAINAHLREHLISGESMANCTWQPAASGAAKVMAPEPSLAA